MSTVALRQKELFDCKIYGEKLTVGQIVWLCNLVIPIGNFRKLHSPWVGPCKIIKCLLDIVYRIQDTRTPRKRIVVHFDRLKPCHERMRMQVDASEQESQASLQSLSTQVQQTTKWLPSGMNLQVVEDSEGEDDFQQNQEAAHSNADS